MSKVLVSDAFRSLKASDHKKMLDLVDTRHHIEGLVTKIARLEWARTEQERDRLVDTADGIIKKGQRYEAFAHPIDPVPPPPPRAVEWGILARKPEILGWCSGGGVAVCGCLRRRQVRGRQCSSDNFFFLSSKRSKTPHP